MGWKCKTRTKYSTPQKRGRFERRLCPDALLRSVDGRLRKPVSLARLACGQIRSLKYLTSDPCDVPGLPSDFGFAAFRGEFDPPSTWRRTKLSFRAVTPGPDGRQTGDG